MGNPKYDRFSSFNASTIYEAAGKKGDLPPSIRPLSPGTRICGPAFTVKCWPGDGSAMARAVNVATAGDILVIDSGVGDNAAMWGGGSTIAALRRGLAGVVTNGSVRDVVEIRQHNYPVFCAGVTIRGSIRNSAGSIGCLLALGNAVIFPGDLVVGDDDGVVVVDQNSLDQVYEGAVERRNYELDLDRRLREGDVYGGPRYAT